MFLSSIIVLQTTISALTHFCAFSKTQVFILIKCSLRQNCSIFNCLEKMSLLRARRTLCLTRITLIKRETPDSTPPKASRFKPFSFFKKLKQEMKTLLKAHFITPIPTSDQNSQQLHKGSRGRSVGSCSPSCG